MLSLSAADVSGAVALGLLAVWPLLRGRRALVLGQAASSLVFGVHYALIGATTGAAVTVLSVVQALAALPRHRSVARVVVFGATLAALGGVCWFTWQGWPSACAAVGMLMAAAGRWHGSASGFRLGFAAAGVAWIVHDVATGSVYGLVADVACLASLGVGAVRERRAVTLTADAPAS